MAGRVPKHVERALAFALVGACALALAAPAHAATYSFERVVDSAEDGFDPFAFGCAGINNGGQIAFRAGRPADDGFNTIPGIYRVNAGGGLVTIAENPRRFGFMGFNPSINELGDVSFAANLRHDDAEAILRGRGGPLAQIATTRGRFAFFGFDTSVNDAGRVAFKAELDQVDGAVEGLFSGGDHKVRTHYLTSQDVLVDGETARFTGTDSRPSINDNGKIAFDESIQPDFNRGIFVGRRGVFETIAAPGDPERSVGTPVLNNTQTAAFETSFTDEETEEFVTAIVTGDGGPLATVADTRGPFAFFGFRPPALANDGEVAFLATLDGSQTTGIFVGPDPEEDRVIQTGDSLDGSPIVNLVFCEEGLNDARQLTFLATFDDANAPSGSRVAIYRATPGP